MSQIAINAGELRHRISLLQPVVGTDESGASVTYSVYATANAKIEWPKAPREVVRAGQTTAQLYLSITMRWIPGVTEEMRVQSRNGTYEIQGIENVGEQNVKLILYCTALGVNQ